LAILTNTAKIKEGTVTAAKTKLTPEQQSAVLYRSITAKIPIIPCHTYPKKEVHLEGWPKIDFSQIDFNAKLVAGEYDNGIALILGKTLSEQYYSFALDFDGWDAVLEWFGSWEQVLSSSQKTRIEWHHDKNRIHYIFFAKRPIANRRIQIKGSKLEVRCENQLLFASPSIHEGGNPYTPIGTNKIAALGENELLSLEAKIDSLSQGYMSDENKQRYIKWLEEPSTIIKEVSRHDAVKILGCSYYYRYNNGWKDLTDDQRYDKLQKWNQQHCITSLPEKEFNDIWRWIVDRHRKNRYKQHQQLEDERRTATEHKEICGVKLDDNIQRELEGNVFYITTNKPLKLIVAYNSTKMLIESSIKTYENEIIDKNANKITQKVNVINQNKLYLTCIPVSIVKHRNPLSFLDAATKYTITFVDGGRQSFYFQAQDVK
jgi:bifunctional DNA primase/polymerase-like protein